MPEETNLAAVWESDKEAVCEVINEGLPLSWVYPPFSRAA